MEDGPSGIITNGGCIHSPGAPPSMYVHGDWSGKLTIGMTNKIGLAKSVTVYTVSRNSRLVSHVCYILSVVPLETLLHEILLVRVVDFYLNQLL